MGKIRDLVAQKPERWFAVRDDRKFRAHWELFGDSLSRPPRGYAADHPAIEDLKRKDFVAIAPLTRTQVVGKGLLALTATRFTEATPLMRFLCAALEVKY